jgi:hypothetical protein
MTVSKKRSHTEGQIRDEWFAWKQTKQLKSPSEHDVLIFNNCLSSNLRSGLGQGNTWKQVLAIVRQAEYPNKLLGY